MAKWRQLSLRSRLTVLGVGGLAAGLAAGGVVVLFSLNLALERSADAEATQAGEDVARLVEEGALPDPVPVAGELLVQVVDAESRVWRASINADRLVPVLRDDELAEVRGGGREYVDGERIGTSGQLRVVAVPVERAGEVGGDYTVLVAKPVADLRNSVQTVRNILLVAYPLLVAGLAVVTWRVVGATLRPVEELRAGAAEISAVGRASRPPGPRNRDGSGSGEGDGRGSSEGDDGAEGDEAGRSDGHGAGEADGYGQWLPVPASQDEIHRLAVTLNDMLDRLEAARARQRAFVADAAHELRSPLANLRTELEVAQHLGDRTDWPGLADDLLADTRRLARLVDDLLLLARADDALPRDRRVEPVELVGLLQTVAERYPSAPVSVIDGPPVWTEGEPEVLRRVVTNLVDNAVRHARSRVVLAAEPEGTHQLVTVTDDGPGIPAADRKRVFDRFTRLDDARGRDAGGAGLGLAIVRELVRRHGGTVRLDEADPGPGLRAEVRLPAATP